MPNDAQKDIFFNRAVLQWFDIIAGLGIFTTDAELTVQYWSSWLEKRTGKPAIKVIGQNLFTVYPELHTRRFNHYYLQVLDGQVVTLSQRFHHYLIPIKIYSADPSLTHMPQSVKIAPLIENTEVIGTITIIEDVTERIEKEISLIREIEVNNVVAELSRVVLSHVTIEDISSFVIRFSAQLTRSKSGWVSFIDQHTGNHVYQSILDENSDTFTKQDADTVLPDIDKLWSRLSLNREVIVINKPEDISSPAVDTDNNIKIFPFLSMPVMIGDKMAGRIALAHSDGNYTEQDIAIVKRIADIYAIAIIQKRAEKKLRESEERFRSVARTAPDAIISSNSDGNIIFWNKGAETIFGYAEEEVLGKNMIILLPEEYRDLYKERVKQLHLTEKVKYAGKMLEMHGLRQNGEEFPMEVSFASWKMGNETFHTVIIRDITERKQMEDALQALSLIDELTGVYNRRGFDTLAQQQLKVAERMKKRLFLIFGDLDKFKKINDALGHKEGDRALIDAAVVLKQTFRGSDIVARIGGDEFAVLVIETFATNRETLAARLHNELHIFNEKGTRPFKLSMSFGIAEFDPEKPCSLDELIAKADELMFEQKRKNHALIH